MDRREELIEYIKNYREVRKQNIKTFLSENILEIIPSFQEKIDFLINEEIKKHRNVGIKFIFLCQILSSGYTGSNEAILGMSSDMLYLDKDRSEVFLYPELFYRSVDEDLAEVKKILCLLWFLIYLINSHKWQFVRMGMMTVIERLPINKVWLVLT